METLGILFILICCIVAIFQVTLLFSAPGEFTISRKNSGKLPKSFRIATLCQIVILIIFSIIVGVKTGVFQKIAITLIL